MARTRDRETLEKEISAALGIARGVSTDKGVVCRYKFALRLCWERMVPIVGTQGAEAIAEYAIKQAAKRCPSVAMVVVGERGLDTSALEPLVSLGAKSESCSSFNVLCVELFQTLVILMGGVLADPLLQEIRQFQDKRWPNSIGA